MKGILKSPAISQVPNTGPNILTRYCLVELCMDIFLRFCLEIKEMADTGPPLNGMIPHLGSRRTKKRRTCLYQTTLSVSLLLNYVRTQHTRTTTRALTLQWTPYRCTTSLSRAPPHRSPCPRQTIFSHNPTHPRISGYTHGAPRHINQGHK